MFGLLWTPLPHVWIWDLYPLFPCHCRRHRRMAPKEIPLLPSSPLHLSHSPWIVIRIPFHPAGGRREDDGGLSHILEQTDTQRIPLRVNDHMIRLTFEDHKSKSFEPNHLFFRNENHGLVQTWETFLFSKAARALWWDRWDIMGQRKIRVYLYYTSLWDESVPLHVWSCCKHMHTESIYAATDVAKCQRRRDLVV